MPLDYSDPHVLKFIPENYELEKNHRVGWFLANRDKLCQYATTKEDSKGHRITGIIKTQMALEIPALSMHHEVSREYFRKKLSPDGPVLGLSWIKKDIHVKPTKTIMKPVEDAESRILYGEKPLGGLRQYLNIRKRKIPEEKYYFCETSSNVIGWQWKDSAFPRRPPKYGRRYTLLREASRSGPQPDPKHQEKEERHCICFRNMDNYPYTIIYVV